MSRGGFARASFEKIQCVNRFVIGNILLSEPVVSTVRRELRRLASGIKIEDEEIAALIRESVLRRDLVEGEDAAAACAKVQKLYKSAAVSKPKQPRPAEPQTTESAPPPDETASPETCEET